MPATKPSMIFNKFESVEIWAEASHRDDTSDENKEQAQL